MSPGRLCNVRITSPPADDFFTQRINDVPKNLAGGFKALYERVIRQLQWQVANDPSLDPGRAGEYANEIALLESRILILDAFLQTLP